MSNEMAIVLRKHTSMPVELLRLVDKINAILMLEPLNEQEVMILAKFIYSEYKDLTLEDIEDSVFKSKSGKLDCNPATYKKLDIDYFGRILTAYRLYKRKENVRLSKKQNLMAIEYNPKENREYECQVAYEFLHKVFVEEESVPLIANWKYAYEHMVNNGMIEVTREQKLIIKDEVLREIREDIGKKKINGLSAADMTQALNDKKYINLECLKKCLTNYFTYGLYRTDKSS